MRAIPKAQLDSIKARRARVAKMRLDGWIQQKIADELGVSVGTVCNDLKEIIKDWREAATRDIAEYQAEQYAHFQTMLETEAAIRDAAMDAGEFDVAMKAVAGLRQTQDRITKLLGTDAPERHEHSVTAGLNDQIIAEADRLLEKLAGKKAADE